VPKTGGTSIERALGIHRDWRLAHLDVLHGRFFLNGTQYLLQHMPLGQTVKFASLFSDVEGFFRFGFVRNPWDRLVSEFFWREEDKVRSFEDFAAHACGCVRDRQALEGENSHFRPQHEFFDGDMDFIGRFERYEQDAAHVFERLGLREVKLPHEGKTAHEHYARYYDEATRRKVHDTYAVDVETFGYRFEG
jgi:hypothetical protein